MSGRARRFATSACAAAAIAVLLAFPLALLRSRGSSGGAGACPLHLPSTRPLGLPHSPHFDARSLEMFSHPFHLLAPPPSPTAAAALAAPTAAALEAPTTPDSTSASVWCVLDCPRCNTRTELTSACRVRPPAVSSRAAALDVRAALLRASPEASERLCVANVFLIDPNDDDSDVVLSWGAGRRHAVKGREILARANRTAIIKQRRVAIDESDDALDGAEFLL